MWTKNILKTKLFETGHDVTTIMCFPCPSFSEKQVQNDCMVIAAFSNFFGIVCTGPQSFHFLDVGVLTLCQSLQTIIVNLPGWCGPPQCKPDGSFEEIQCCASTGKCYCVDREGKKVEGTEQNGKPDCEGTT